MGEPPHTPRPGHGRRTLGGSGERGVRGARRGMRGGAPSRPANRDSNYRRAVGVQARGPPILLQGGRQTSGGAPNPHVWAETSLLSSHATAQEMRRAGAHLEAYERHAIRARDPCGETHVAVRGRDLEGRRLVCRKRGHIFKIWHEGRRGKTGGGGVHTRTIAMAPPPPVCAVTCFVANPASSRLRVPRRPLPGAQADKTRPLYSNARRRGPSDPFPPTPASGGRRLGGRFSSRSHFSLSVVVRLDRRHRQSTGLGDGRTPGFVAGA